jgi:hypothetical protein
MGGWDLFCVAYGRRLERPGGHFLLTIEPIMLRAIYFSKLCRYTLRCHAGTFIKRIEFTELVFTTGPLVSGLPHRIFRRSSSDAMCREYIQSLPVEP